MQKPRSESRKKIQTAYTLYSRANVAQHIKSLMWRERFRYKYFFDDDWLRLSAKCSIIVASASRHHNSLNSIWIKIIQMNYRERLRFMCSCSRTGKSVHYLNCRSIFELSHARTTRTRSAYMLHMPFRNVKYAFDSFRCMYSTRFYSTPQCFNVRRLWVRFIMMAA